MATKKGLTVIAQGQELEPGVQLRRPGAGKHNTSNLNIDVNYLNRVNIVTSYGILKLAVNWSRDSCSVLVALIVTQMRRM